MNGPVRIQRKRTKGFSLQLESIARNGLPCICINRPSKFGNPYRLIKTENHTEIWTAFKPPGISFRHSRYRKTERAREAAIELFRYHILQKLLYAPNFLDELQGKNLACFCSETLPCHGDVLLELVRARL